jgi:hypothetical protein
VVCDRMRLLIHFVAPLVCLVTALIVLDRIIHIVNAVRAG